MTLSLYYLKGGEIMEEKKSNDWLDWTKAFLIALIVTLAVKHFLFSPVVVDGESMTPTLQHRDRMIVDKISYRFKEPERFDIIIFHAPTGRDYIKRVIGLPGEHVEVKGNELYIDGELVEQPFLNGNDSGPDFTLENLNHSTIPDGELIVFGDNRYGSRDSRDYSIGLVDVDEVVGKTSLIYWPLNRIQSVKE